MVWAKSTYIFSFTLFCAHITAVSVSRVLLFWIFRNINSSIHYPFCTFVFFQIKHLSKGNVHDAELGEQKDISEINLGGFNFFIINNSRNALRDPSTRWKFPIPYILADNLALNAKGAILYAFEMFRLRSCVDFKPYEGESTYIIFQQFSGCWSMVGDQQVGQNLSIGQGCDYKAIIEHEILHALGFYHEQSRTDRDDYVNIWWDEIISGYEHNFNTYDDDFITDLNTPYDYESVMHYAPFSFNKNESVPTITAKIAEFDSVIGQRLDFSALDLERLNRMYNCTSTHTLLDHCAFEKANICGMIQGTRDDADWVHEDSAQAGQVDHTLLGQCRGAGYFMQFNTSSGAAEEAALLESRILYPKRKQQCLQFFYKMTGSPSDRLVVWVRRDDSTGNVRKLVKVKTFQGTQGYSCKDFHRTFSGTKAASDLKRAGIYLDDVLDRKPCAPQGFGTQGPGGAEPRVSVRGIMASGWATSVGSWIAFIVQAGRCGILEWPVETAAIIKILQGPRGEGSPPIVPGSRSYSINGSVIWDRPSRVGSYDTNCDCFRSLDWGWNTFISHQMLGRRSFLKNDDLIMFVDFEDITYLNQTEVPARGERLSPQDLVLQGREQQQASQEGSGPAVAVGAQPGVPGQGQPGRQRRSVDNTGPLEDHNWPQYFRDPCDPNPCQNDGICVNVKGMASCRCVSGHAFFYTGERCQAMQVDGSVLGLMIGGTAGVVFLTFTIISILRRTPRQ
uniref:Meprin A subunit n=1 Tax=Microcebus murinus TaxID=30608 RepID=A0A8C5XHU8_MICMU